MLNTTRTRQMQRQRRRQVRKMPKARPDSIPAPIGGWNTRDALDAMAPTDAVLLDNWFPTTGKVTMRRGYTEHATGMGSSNVDTIAEYHAGSNRKLLAAANGNIYDASSTGAASSLASGFTSNQWQWSNLNGRIFFVNGTDAPQDYDGSTMSATSWTGSGLTIANLIGVNVFKSRLYFWEDDSQDFWYAGPAAITGTLTKFPLSRVGQFGGNLVAMGTWTFDGGAGPDDYAVFIMSSGDVIVYQGSDPGSFADWALVGVYNIGEPLGIRGVVKTGGDLLIMTHNDYVSMGAVLKTGQLGDASKLSGAVQEASANASLFGWQAITHRKGNKGGFILFNVPGVSNKYDQHVINAATGAACRFRDIPARCWGVYNSGLYFGSTNGKIYQFDTAWKDDGAAIPADGRSAWSSYGTPTRNRVTAIRPVIESQGEISYSVGLGFDFNASPLPAPSQTALSLSLWDVALWDVALWSPELSTSLKWKAAKGSGQSISTRVKIEGEQEISWVRTDYRLEQGTAL